MPRTARASVGNLCYHVLNRGNARQQVFFKDGDYAAFLKAMSHACVEVPMRVVGWCLMPNHFHLVLWPHHDGDLSDWMQWLCNTHVRRYHRHYRSSGHLWQGRFKAFAIEQDEHLLTVLRYVERNALRASLVERAELWPWSSLHTMLSFADAGPVPRPADWIDLVNEPMTEAELTRLRDSVNRGRPFGSEPWQHATAKRLGVEASLRPRGRPRKEQGGENK
jgi:putative transposase